MPGEMLAAARLAAEMSVAQVSEATKIPPAALQAIERDEYHKISGDLYVKSFLRLYSEAVGLDPEEILDAYRRFVGEVSVTADGDEVPAWGEDEVQVKGIGLPWHKIIPVAAAVVLVALAIFFFRGCGDSVDPVATETQETAASMQPAAADSSADQETPPVELTETVEEAPDGGTREEAAPITIPVPADDPPATPVRNSSAAPAGVADLKFRDGRTRPLVLRVVCDRPQDLRVQVDGQGSHLPAFWPAAGTAAPRIQDDRPEPGRVYAAGEGFVVYWGAEDHFSLILERLGGVTVTTNGEARDLSRVRPGQEWILDVHPPGYFVKP